MYFSKKLTENRCLLRCLDVSLDVAQQINALWEPLQRLAPLFNVNTKADFLVRISKLECIRKEFVLKIIQVGVKCLETAVYGACKRIEILSSSLIDNNDTSDDNESLTKVSANDFNLLV